MTDKEAGKPARPGQTRATRPAPSKPPPAPEDDYQVEGALEEVLKTKTAEEILAPRPIVYEMVDREGDNHSFEILPMVDGALIVLGDSLQAIMGLFENISEELPGFGTAQFGASVMKLLVPKLPAILLILLPHSSRLIAATLDVDEEWVARNFTLPMKLEMLALILEAEDIPALLKTLGALVATFQKVSRRATPAVTTR